MNQIRARFGHVLLSAGMIYALITIFAVPASAACTQADCDSIQQGVDFLCEQFNCNSGGHVISCTSSGFAIFCNGCGVKTGTCP